MSRWMTLFAFIAVSGCSGAAVSQCPAQQLFQVVGYSTKSYAYSDGLAVESSPYPTDATFLYFSTSNDATYGSNNPFFVSGNPILTGSDGSRIIAGALMPDEGADITVILFGYTSSVAGLKPNLTYNVSFASTTANPSGCRYGLQNSGSFTTN